MITGGNKIFGVSGAVPVYTPRHAATVNEAAKERGAVSRFDSIMLSERQGNYAMQLTGKLTQEVRSSVTPGKLSSLREQIASGQYQPDPMSIARRMLLLPEDA